MNGADVVVTIKRGLTETSATAVCGSDGTLRPCAGQTTTPNLYVFMKYDTQPVVPLVPIPDNVTGKGVFRCEFS